LNQHQAEMHRLLFEYYLVYNLPSKISSLMKVVGTADILWW